MQNVPAVAVPLDPLASYIYIQHEMSHMCLQPRSIFAWIIPLRNIISPTQYYFPNHRSIILILKCSFLWKKKLYGPFHGWGSTASRLEWEPLWGGSLLFTIKFPEIAGTHFLSTSERKTTKILWNLIKKRGISRS